MSDLSAPSKIGLIGCGVVANYGHAPAIRSLPELQLAAVFDPNQDRAVDFAQRHGIGAQRAFSDMEAFLASGLDAVTITSPAPAHHDNVLAAAEHKLPVLCEKPLAMDEAEGRAMIRAAEKAGISLHVAFCYRFSLAALEIKKLIDQGAIGPVRSLRLIYNWDCHGKYYQPDAGHRPDHWEVDPRRLGRMLEGGPMVDCGTHQIDLATWWLGSAVTNFTGHGAWVDEYEAPDHVWTHLDHANGAHTMVEMSFSYGHTTRHKYSEFVYELIGESGMIRYDRNHSFFELRTDQESRRLDYHHEKNFTEMYRAFGHLLRTGDPGHLCSAQDALNVTRIARSATDEAIARRAAQQVAAHR